MWKKKSQFYNLVRRAPVLSEDAADAGMNIFELDVVLKVKV